MKIYLDSKGYTDKPSGKEIGNISTRIVENPVDISIEEFAKELTLNGRTAIACQFSYPRLSKVTPIVEQELVMLDFDNKDSDNTYTIKDMLEDPFIQQHASFWYKTFNHDNKESDRFRVVFQLGTPLKRNTEVEDVYHFLLNKYPNADQSCNTVNRLFFGSTTGYNPISFDNRLKIRDLELITFLMLHPVYGNKNIRSVDEIIFNKETPNWELFKAHQYSLIKEKIGNKYRREYSSLANARKIMKLSINMVDLLELPRSKTFRDILHFDDSPSASVFKSDSGALLYHCHSHNHKFTGDLLYLVSKLTRTSISEATTLLLDLTGSSIDFDSDISKIKRNIEMFSSLLLDDDTRQQHPDIYKFFGNNTPEIVAILNVMVENAYEDFETGEVRILNFLGLDKLSHEVSKILGRSTSKSTISRIINQLTFVDVLNKLPQEEIPKAIDSVLNKTQKKNKYKMKTSVYDLTDFENNKFEHISDKSKLILLNGYTASAFSYEFILRMFGETDANKVFPQNKNQQISESSVELENIIVDYIFDRISHEKFVLEKDIKYFVSTYKGLNIQLSDYKWKQIRADIVNKYGLTRGRLTKSLKEELSITTDKPLSNPIIIY